MTLKEQIKDYYQLTKPGIIRGNLITASAGFFLASQQDVKLTLLLAMLLGLGLVIASACVSNNYLDQGIDRKMARTANRAIADGRITGRQALVYAAVLGVLGFAILAVLTPPLAPALAVIGYLAYVFLYGYYKRRSTISTAVGSISGAIPPVVGYVAVTNQIDIAAVLLFMILVFWQMPHFFAIAIYRLKDYAAAGLPVLPVKEGIRATKIQMIIYIVGYSASSLALTAFDYTGSAYAFVMIVLCSGWLFVTIREPKSGDEAQWARKVFLVSLVAITLQCITIALDAIFIR